MKHSRFWLATFLIVAGALLRLAPHPWDFTPTGAIALFAGATYRRTSAAFTVPLISLLISDALIGFHSGMPIVYAAFALSVCLGWWIRRRHTTTASVAMGAVASATLFYLVTNLWVWAGGHNMYEKTLGGLLSCYAAAIPFYMNHLAGDLFYSAALFGVFVWAQRRVPVFADPNRAA